ncbi:MAG: hypothetical protein U9N38_06885 [Thermodesulfobacteriota bacterium]|nr:hypothetical protein [Thermodesulfobacteriota bacterium]
MNRKINMIGGGFFAIVRKRGPGFLGAIPTSAIAEATAMKKIDSDTIGGTTVRKYEDEDAAMNAEDSVRREYEGRDADVKIKVDHEYIIIKEKVSIEEMVSEL